MEFFPYVIFQFDKMEGQGIEDFVSERDSRKCVRGDRFEALGNE